MADAQAHTDDSSAAPADPLAGFPLRSFEKLRYNDTDRQGHVNNAVFATFFETGRVELADRIRETNGSSKEFVLARITIDYVRELLWPGDVAIGSRIVRIGNSSITLEQLVVCEGLVHAKAESVMVLTDTSTRKSTPFDDRSRSVLDSLR